MEIQRFLNDRVIVKVSDITDEDVDAIVNAANSSLLGGGGVDGAIHARGGSQILKECREIRAAQYPNGLPPGEAVITSGGHLKAQHVIHTVGPIYGSHGGNEDDLLANSYRNSLLLASDRDIKSIAFPSISTGAFAFPRERAAEISSRAIQSFLEGDAVIEQVRLVFFSRNDAQVFLVNHRFDEA